jgi:hypothetical protein
MQRRNLSDRIIKLDRNIRFVGVVNSRGEVIEGGFQHGVQPLLEGTDEQQMYIQSLSNMTMFQNYSDRLGKVRYSITEHEKVTLMTFPLDDGILCVSASPKANINKIRNKVSKVIKKRPAAKKRRRKSRQNDAKD